MSIRVQNPLLNARINGLAEIRNAAYPLDLTLRGGDLLGRMDELTERHGRYSQADTDSLLASLEAFEPTETELEDMYAKRDLEDMDALVSYR